MTNKVTRMQVPGMEPRSYAGLAIGGPLDGLLISHNQPSFTVAKMPATTHRLLSEMEVDQALFETVSYTYQLLLAHSKPFGLFLSSVLLEAAPDEAPLVTGVRELVQRYSDTTANKAVPAERSEKRRH